MAEGQYRCEKCGRHYIYSRTLEKHMKDKHGKPEANTGTGAASGSEPTSTSTSAEAGTETGAQGSPEARPEELKIKFRKEEEAAPRPEPGSGGGDEGETKTPGFGLSAVKEKLEPYRGLLLAAAGMVIALLVLWFVFGRRGEEGAGK